jgi:hypothetical protein
MARPQLFLAARIRRVTPALPSKLARSCGASGGPLARAACSRMTGSSSSRPEPAIAWRYVDETVALSGACARKFRSPGERANAQLKTWRGLRGLRRLRCCPGGPDNSPKPSTFFRSARQTQDKKGLPVSMPVIFVSRIWARQGCLIVFRRERFRDIAAIHTLAGPPETIERAHDAMRLLNQRNCGSITEVRRDIQRAVCSRTC